MKCLYKIESSLLVNFECYKLYYLANNISNFFFKNLLACRDITSQIRKIFLYCEILICYDTLPDTSETIPDLYNIRKSILGIRSSKWNRKYLFIHSDDMIPQSDFMILYSSRIVLPVSGIVSYQTEFHTAGKFRYSIHKTSFSL
jgi:hypothetical protein